MAQYSPEQRRKNRLILLIFGAISLGVVLASSMGADAVILAMLGRTTIWGVFMAWQWWIFGSGDAAAIDYRVTRSTTEVPSFPERVEDDTPLGQFLDREHAKTANLQDAVHREPAPIDTATCPDCGLGFGAASGTSHVGCKTP